MHWRIIFFFYLSKIFLFFRTISPNLCPLLILIPVQHIPYTHAQWFVLSVSQQCRIIGTNTPSDSYRNWLWLPVQIHSFCTILLATLPYIVFFLQIWSWKVTGYHMLWQHQVISSIIKFQIQVHHIRITIQQR